MVDLLITDESSVAYEALLFNIKTLTVDSWLMRTSNTVAPRMIKPSDITHSSTLATFSENIERFINSKKDENDLNPRDKHFSNIGMSAKKIMDLVDSSVDNLKPSHSILSVYKISKSITWKRRIIYLMSRLLPRKFRKFLLIIIIKNHFMERYLGSRV